MYTAASIMRLVDHGILNLDDAAHIHVDPLLLAANGSDMNALFGPTAGRVTIRHLMSMRSGLYDFDDDHTRRFQNTHPQFDISPIDDLWFASKNGHKRPLYPAGSSQDYSSTNFELLGLVLMRHANKSRWDEFEQRRAIFTSEALRRRFPRTQFALRGPCLSPGYRSGQLHRLAVAQTDEARELRLPVAFAASAAARRGQVVRLSGCELRRTA